MLRATGDSQNSTWRLEWRQRSNRAGIFSRQDRIVVFELVT